MFQSIRSHRFYKPVVWVISGVLFIFVFWLAMNMVTNPKWFLGDDFVEYWAAGKLNLAGGNPYDPGQLHPLEIQTGAIEGEAVMMWNPPWLLTLIMPFGVFEYGFSRALWLIPEEDMAERYEVLLAREKVYDLLGERRAQQGDLAALHATASALYDARRQAQVALRQAQYAIAVADTPAAIERVQEAVTLAQASEATDLEARRFLMRPDVNGTTAGREAQQNPRSDRDATHGAPLG